MPNGTLNGEDIEAELAGGAQSIVGAMKGTGLFATTSEGFLPEFSDASIYNVRWVKVGLKSASFNVCAKKWGLGNKREYTGIAMLQFEWSLRDVVETGVEPHWGDKVTVDAVSADPKSIAQFISLGLVKSFEANKILR
ncbi:hypothetical protein C1T17_14715 [Sphingobium sp. SCG-1]|nr:hypothetical protein C1T17_14715 [Sphingobium sp. SCG-1]